MDFNYLLERFILFFFKALDVSLMSSLLKRAEWSTFSLFGTVYRSSGTWAQSQVLLLKQLEAMSSSSGNLARNARARI